MTIGRLEPGGTSFLRTTGAEFILTNMFGERWKQTKDVNVNVKQQQLSIAIDPDSKLAERMRRAGVVIDQFPEALTKQPQEQRES